MKALVHTAPYKLEIKEVAKPEISDGEVLIKIAAVGICGSDVHGFTGKTGRRIPPVIMGHEAAGKIVEVSEDSAYSVGDRVTFDSTIYCGKCPHCLDGRVNLCSDRRVIGVSCDDYLQDGAMTEYIAVPERILYKLPANVEYKDASLIEPASVAYHAVSLVDVLPDDHVIVVGVGVIGVIIVQALKIAGCKNIIAVDIDDFRLEVAKYYGADTIINSREMNPAEYVDKNLKDQIDIVFEAVGIEDTVSMSFNTVRKGGSVVLVGNVTPEVKFPLQKVVTTELRVFGSCASAGEYPIIIKDLAESKLNFDRIITAQAPLEDGEMWFKTLHAGNHNQIKVVLIP